MLFGLTRCIAAAQGFMNLLWFEVLRHRHPVAQELRSLLCPDSGYLFATQDFCSLARRTSLS